jgi:hypothetical protein
LRWPELVQKLSCSSVRLILHRHTFPDPYPKYLTTRRRQRHTRKGKALKIHLGRSWHPGYSVSSSLMTLNLPLGHRSLPVYGQAPYLSASSSILGGACSSLNPYAGSYHRATKTTQGIPIGLNSYAGPYHRATKTTQGIPIRAPII